LHGLHLRREDALVGNASFARKLVKVLTHAPLLTDLPA
jgi:hypothetical protein